MMHDKRGFIPVITVGLIVAVTIFAVVLFAGVSFVTWILAANVWRLAGLLVLTIALLAFLGKVPVLATPKTMMILIAVGTGLVLLPFLSDTFSQPLAAIFP